ncbi:MAG: hypothetical protein A2Z12_08380 [Actinobacteria bacterium RBG_16_68_21]|nr:MAG: hypothetical protein A2Z12_08380 [Actinobacteria bacterium RBG_16_68_21]
MTDNAPRADRPNRWFGPTILLAVVAAVIIVFVASNSAKAPSVGFAGWKWHEVPVWLVIVVSMVAGAIGSPLVGRVWRAWRRRRRRLADELDALRRHAAGADS